MHVQHLNFGRKSRKIAIDKVKDTNSHIVSNSFHENVMNAEKKSTLEILFVEGMIRFDLLVALRAYIIPLEKKRETGGNF